MVEILFVVALAGPVPAPVTPARLGTADLRHGGVIRGLAFSPDGKLLASAGHDRLVSVWSVATGKELARCPGHEADATCVSWSPDGKTLASGAADGTVRLWDAAGNPLHTIAFKSDTVGALAFSPDGRSLAAGLDDGIAVVDVATRKVTTHLAMPEAVRCLAWSPDGREIACNGGSKLAVAIGRANNAAPPRGFGTEPVAAIAWAGGGIATWEPGSVVRLTDTGGKEERRWNAGSPKWLGEHRAMIYQIAYDGNRLAAGTIDGRVIVWDAKDRPGPGWKGHTGRTTAVTLHDNTLASAGSDGVIRLWDATTGKMLSPSSDLEQSIRGLSSDGKRLAIVLDYGDVLFYGLDGRRLGGPVKAEARRAMLAPSGDLLAVPFNGGVTRYADGKPTPMLTSTVRDADLSADGKTLATADDDGKLWLRSADGATRRECEAREKRQVPVVSPRGAFLTALTGAAAVQLLDGRDGRHRRALPGHRGGTTAAAFTADERILITGGRDRMLRFWDVDTGLARYSPRGQSDYVTAVASHGPFVASGTADGVVQVRAARGGTLLFEGRGHRGPVTALTFAGDKLVSGGADTTVLLWDVSRLRVERPAALTLSDAQREELWKALLGDDGVKAAAAQEKLTLSGEGVLALIRRDVRRVPAGQTAQWVADLDSDEFAVREAAYAGLRRCGPLVTGVLRKVLDGKPSLDLRRRVERLLNDIAGGPSADALRHLRSVEVLEELGTPRAEYALLDLASGAAEAELTGRARSALERLRRGR